MRALILTLCLAGAAEAPTPSPTPAAEKTVLVLRSGHQLVVRSYEEDGRLLRAVGLDGGPVLLKSADLDREKTEAATARYRKELARAESDERAAAEAAERAAAKRLEDRARRKARRPAGSGGGTMNVAPEVASEATSGAPRDPATDEKPARAAKREGDRLRARHRALVGEYNSLVKELSDNPMADYASGRVKLQALADEIEGVERDLAAAAQDRAKR